LQKTPKNKAKTGGKSDFDIRMTAGERFEMRGIALEKCIAHSKR
jgi:hypothetical protein